ncbi:hypothetical protein ACH4VM_04875 [Streptomyces sp. NPDC020792]|uniref:hypothetical protein n=1 Tax=Streptomyces sp. NPDC020792 TaxID=3365089 RepID=UPI0037B13133
MRGKGLTAVSDAALLRGAFGEAVLHTDGVIDERSAQFVPRADTTGRPGRCARPGWTR